MVFLEVKGSKSTLPGLQPFKEMSDFKVKKKNQNRTGKCPRQILNLSIRLSDTFLQFIQPSCLQILKVHSKTLCFLVYESNK